MNYAVIWQAEAENRLADLWMNHLERQRVGAAADRADLILGHNPEEQGESRDPGVRLMFVDRLEVLFRIDEPAREVVVMSISWAGGR